MSYESTQGFDKNLIFRETFNSAMTVQNNAYSKGSISATGIKFDNGIANFSTVNASIVYRKSGTFFPTNFSLRFIISFSKINVTSGSYGIITTSASGLGRISLVVKSSTLYLDTWGSASPANVIIINNISLNTQYEVILSTVGSTVNIYVNGNLISTYSLGNRISSNASLTISSSSVTSTLSLFSLQLLEVYNKAFTASEVNLLFQGQIYVDPAKIGNNNYGLPLLLDFDSTRGIIEDRTGKNTLTATNVSIQKIGKVYSAYFKTNVGININSPVINNTGNFIINTWIKVLNYKNTVDFIYAGNFFVYAQGNGTIAVVFDGTTVSATIIPYTSKLFNYIMVIKENSYAVYVNGYNIRSFTSCTRLPVSNLFLGYPNGAYNSLKGYIPKVQVFQGIPSNPDLFASQIYNSQKGQFSL